MIRNFVFKEMVETLLGPKFIVTFIISLILILTSVYSGYRLYEAETQWYVKAESKNIDRMENLGSYGVLRNRGTKVLREPSLMSIFVKGVDSAIGRSSMVSTDVNNSLKDSRFGLNPIFAVFGELDLAFIVKMILSLFALLFSYTAISGERETGTLKLVLSNSVGRAKYIIGKTIGGLIPLFLTLLIPLLISLIMLMVVFDVSFGTDEWVRLGMIVLIALLYLTTFYIIGMFLSSITRNSSLTFLLALGVWVLSVVVLPRLSVEVASQISPAPSIDQVEAERAALQREFYGEMEPLYEEGLKKLYTSGDQVTTEKWRALEKDIRDKARAKIEDREKKVLADYKRDHKKLLETSMNIARISPTSCVTFSMNRLAQTDASVMERFEQGLDRYREQFIKFLEEKMKQYPDQIGGGVSTSVSSGDRDGVPYLDIKVRTPKNKIKVNDLAKFSSEAEPLSGAINAALVDMAILAFEILLFFLLATFSFMRYDVR